METAEHREERLKIMQERERETRAVETDDEREVRLERHRQREIRDVETAEQREERLKIMWERPIERTAMETAEQRDLNFGCNEMTVAAVFPSIRDLPAKVFNITVSHTATGTEVIDRNTILFATLKRAGLLINNS